MKVKKFKPLYPSKDYQEFCDHQKAKGLRKRYWKDLPKMWKKELEFREELEDALNKLINK